MAALLEHLLSLAGEDNGIEKIQNHLGEFLGLSCSLYIAYRQGSPMPYQYFSEAVDPKLSSTYFDELLHENIWAKTYMKQQLPESALFLTTEHLSMQEYCRSVWYGELMQPFGMRDVVAMIFRLPIDGQIHYLNLSYLVADDEPEISADKRRELRNILEPLRLILRTRLASERQMLASVMDNPPYRGDVHAQLLLKPDATVVRLNAAAEQLLRRSKRLLCRAGKLQLVDPQAQAHLAATVKRYGQLFSTPHCHHSTTPVNIALKRAHNPFPYLLEISPFMPFRRGWLSELGLSLVKIIDTEQVPRLREDLLRETYDLTLKELQVVVGLGQGKDLATVSAEMGNQVGTARNHLKSIFLKTQVKKQGELISLLSHFRCT